MLPAPCCIPGHSTLVSKVHNRALGCIMSVQIGGPGLGCNISTATWNLQRVNLAQRLVVEGMCQQQYSK